MKIKIALILACFFSLTAYGQAAQPLIAVAANFSEPVREIAKAFQKKTGEKVNLTFGATGTFYQQIVHDAPFDVFLAADQSHVQQAIDNGYAVATSRFTYAVGRLVLWSAKKRSDFGPNVLTDSAGVTIAYCNPDTAPYGQAAVETLENLGILQKVKTKLVEGQNIAQAFQFVKTGNAEIGFVALSQVINDENGSQWLVPQTLYKPIRQDGVLLNHGKDSDVARQFLDFLKSDHTAQKIIEKFGYRLPAEGAQ